ncbi:hypothetical protein M011DRAFT_530226 [Sporormia fimetaria CBS 119925]|uniref:Uncharacterized protein n=1 Tax=Sporormia fimetaria CBS 119925 TaxID=1340428 RepID=A0A6A6UWZ5_9PLEO|nr:hypothetical protein M011DRAFT_530226 [Sporormia fimetaria CBS 119925]
MNLYADGIFVESLRLFTCLLVYLYPGVLSRHLFQSLSLLQTTQAFGLRRAISGNIFSSIRSRLCGPKPPADTIIRAHVQTAYDTITSVQVRTSTVTETATVGIITTPVVEGPAALTTIPAYAAARPTGHFMEAVSAPSAYGSTSFGSSITAFSEWLSNPVISPLHLIIFSTILLGMFCLSVFLLNQSHRRYIARVWHQCHHLFLIGNTIFGSLLIFLVLQCWSHCGEEHPITMFVDLIQEHDSLAELDLKEMAFHLFDWWTRRDPTLPFWKLVFRGVWPEFQDFESTVAVLLTLALRKCRVTMEKIAAPGVLVSKWLRAYVIPNTWYTVKLVFLTVWLICRNVVWPLCVALAKMIRYLLGRLWPNRLLVKIALALTDWTDMWTNDDPYLPMRAQLAAANMSLLQRLELMKRVEYLSQIVSLFNKEVVTGLAQRTENYRDPSRSPHHRSKLAPRSTRQPGKLNLRDPEAWSLWARRSTAETFSLRQILFH